ncbi:PHP-associated domain-containing protein [Halogeometricum luteum]|uniref:PHP domain-containing protein n=1 Tax=Halogeometricum luteum TaxID=2950537 RepID=A0ABU2G1W8_9EURY|nr:PHP-associated domain-containing protein [Halogeometricum sp. S3BR5-2]MDS0294486.1 PHP domain-containing protein [Halogeometricum sp. S3BR5-2]
MLRGRRTKAYRPLERVVFAVDLHTHSRFFHWSPGRPTRFDPVGLSLSALAGRLRGLDAVAVTNHDYAYASQRRFPTIPGIEVSTTMGHLLVVGPDPPSRTRAGELTPAEAVDEAHDRGCAAIVAHPYRNSSLRDTEADFDAVELNGKNPEHVVQTRELAERLDLPLTGGSDAHYPFEVGRAYTLVDADELTPAAVADAIRSGETEAVVNLNRFEEELDRAYTRIHHAKGAMDGGSSPQ